MVNRGMITQSEARIGEAETTTNNLTIIPAPQAAKMDITKRLSAQPLSDFDSNIGNNS